MADDRKEETAADKTPATDATNVNQDNATRDADAKDDAKITENSSETAEKVAAEQPKKSANASENDSQATHVGSSKRQQDHKNDEKQQSELKTDQQLPVAPEDNKAVQEDDAKMTKTRAMATNEDTVSSLKRKANLPQRPLKRARTAYFIFAEDQRPKLHSEHPGESVAATARRLGQLWSALNPEEKTTYQERAAQERQRVAQELEAWKAAGGSMDELNPSSSSWTYSADSTVFPIARVRKICKLDPDVRGLSKEALLLVTKCTEFFTAQLGKEAVKVAQIQNRRKLLPDDVAQVCSSRAPYLFLKDDVRDLVQDQIEQRKVVAGKDGDKNGANADGKIESAKASANTTAAMGSKPLTSYFSVGK